MAMGLEFGMKLDENK